MLFVKLWAEILRAWMSVSLNTLHAHHTDVYQSSYLLSGRWKEWYKHLRINASLRVPSFARLQTNINTFLSHSAISLSPHVAPLLHSLSPLAAMLPSIIIRRGIYALSTPATTLCSLAPKGQERRGKQNGNNTLSNTQQYTVTLYGYTVHMSAVFIFFICFALIAIWIDTSDPPGFLGFLWFFWFCTTYQVFMFVSLQQQIRIWWHTGWCSANQLCRKIVTMDGWMVE